MKDWTTTLDIEATSTAMYEKISFKGKLVYSTQQIARQKLHNILEKTTNEMFLLDVSELSFVDSTGLAIFIHFLKREFDKKKKFAFVCSHNEAIKKLFTIAKFHKLFLFAKTEQEAVQWLMGNDHWISD
jgi:anti-anti-sigma factor